ncbi:MAG: MurT ligase domain-containing protein [Actinomycetota bacterium]|nr:MurT ligase domain-containing protein [Actinomycetota bacterium]
MIGGRAILAIDPAALSRLSRGRRIALVSGTNGKTTTTSLLSAALSRLGPVVSNALGANLPPGLTAALAAAPPDARHAALEVDEAWLGQVVDTSDPEVVLLLNLSRDQLDRNNEVRRLSASWRAMIAGRSALGAAVHVVANADDPLVAWAAEEAESVTWVGAGQRWTADAAGCPNCAGRIQFPDDIGEPWACQDCHLRRPALDVWLDGDDVLFADGTRIPVRLQLPGRCNQANAAMATSAAARLGVDRHDALAAMTATTEVAGRYGTIEVGDVSARLLLAKNPAGWLEVFDLLSPAPTPVVVAINAQIADGKDPSWLWDVPFERLQGRLVLATGERSADLAVRLRYADVDHRRQPDMLQAIREAGANRVDVVANYTSFQAINRRRARGA